MRLIDADALHDALRAKQKWIVKRENMVNEGYTYDQVHFAIDDMPTVDAVPVRHGKWIGKSTDGEQFDCCSECGYIEWDAPNNFCPNCGAKMYEE